MRILKKDYATGEIKLQCESLEDLWHVERVLQEGDTLRAKSWRRFKVEGSDDSGEKKEVNLELTVERVEFAKLTNRLRVSGKIKSGTPEELVQAGSYHTIDLELHYPFSIIKIWKTHQLKRLEEAVSEGKRPKIALCAMDDEKAVFATLRGYGVAYEFELENSASKRDEKYEEKQQKYFAEIEKKLESYKVEKLIVAGPGFAKENLKKMLERKRSALLPKIVWENCSYAEKTGINELLKKGVVSKVAGEQRIEEEAKLLENFLLHLHKDDGLCAYGIAPVKNALELSAASQLLVLDELLRTKKEIEPLLELAEKKKVKILIFSEEGEPGKQLANFGGFAAMLKFRIS